jgi:3-methylcrotonyl-CoA carboxylase beta subunit
MSQRIRTLLPHASRRARFSGNATTRKFHSAVLPSLVSPSAPDFVAKAQAMDGLVADLEAKLAQNRMGGGEKALARMRSKGKKLPRERCIMRISIACVQAYNLCAYQARPIIRPPHTIR